MWHVLDVYAERQTSVEYELSGIIEVGGERRQIGAK